MVASADDLPALLGEAPSFVAMLEQVSRVAPINRPLLVIGERGTGKELVGARLHYLSKRWDKPFVKVNCAALSEELLDSELFGHEAGAFTGANRRHVGRFERADGGALFLDEIASASLRVQEKLLRAVEYGEFERVGGADPLRVDVRVIGATNVDLPAQVAAGRFRADLLDRLAFDVVTLPPLRDRPEDIPLLAAHFGQAMARELDEVGRFPGFTAAAVERMIGQPWPGNVRELKNVVERTVAKAGLDQPIADVALDPFHSPHRLATGPFRPQTDSAESPSPLSESIESSTDSPAPFAEQVRRFEIGLIERAMTANRYNRRRAAKDLGLTYDQFRGYLRKYALPER